MSKYIPYIKDGDSSFPTSAVSVVNEDGTNEFKADDIKTLSDKIGDLSGQGIIETNVAEAVKNDRVVMSNYTNQINAVNTNMGSLSSLTTDYKTDLVGAVNEHEVQINSNTTQLADITANKLPLKANQSDLNTTNTKVSSNTSAITYTYKSNTSFSQWKPCKCIRNLNRFAIRFNSKYNKW